MFGNDNPISVLKMTESIKQRLKFKNSDGSMFYIGRGSPLGNPYSSKESSKGVCIVDNSKEAIQRFSDDLWGGLLEPEAYEYLGSIISASNQCSISLVCFCKPNPCHGDVIRDYILKGRENAKI